MSGEEKISLYNSIHKAIREFTIGTGGTYPKVIIVNPGTWHELCQELLELGKDFHRNLQESRGYSFNGYPVYRSSDVPEGDFVVY